MKLSKLLNLHLADADSVVLEQNFGDAFLCQHNKVYRNIRLKALNLGFTYSHEQNDAYQALPLSQLSEILLTKKIPFLDNVGVLKKIEKIMPDQTEWHELSQNLRKNFLLHESCHAVARELAGPLPAGDFGLKMLIEESFANTCELLGVVDAGDSAHRIFYEWNSYTALFESRNNIKAALDEIGKEEFFKLIFFGYLHSNFLFDRFDDLQFNKMLAMVSEGFNAKQLKTARALLKICFTLDRNFREITTNFYLKLSGVDADFRQADRMNYLDRFEKISEYRDYLSRLGRVAASV